jgi:hypothetical protein
MSAPTTPQAVADALAVILPHRVNIYDVELIASTNGARARATVGHGGRRRFEICGLGEELETAIVDLYNEAERWEPRS